MYNAQALEELMRVIIVRGMSFDLEQGFTFKLHEQYPQAPRSPVKFNLATAETRKDGKLTEEDVLMMGLVLWDFAKHHKLAVSAITGVPNVGEKLAEALQYQLRFETGQYVPLIPMRKVEGSRNIDAVVPAQDYPPPGVVLCMDDVLTMGHSALEAIDKLTEAKYRVKDVLVVLDYNFGGRSVLGLEGITAWALLTLESIIVFGRDERLIPAHYLEAMRRYYEEMKDLVRTGGLTTPALAS